MANLGELDQAMDRFIELHQRRQRMLGRPGCFASPRFTDFHRDVAARMLAAGQLQLHTLWIDGRPAAAEYQFVGDGVVYAYQSGIDPTRLDLAAGTRHAIGRARLGDRQRLSGLRFFARRRVVQVPLERAAPRQPGNPRRRPARPAAQLRHAVWLAGVEARQWIRRGLHHLTVHAGRRSQPCRRWKQFLLNLYYHGSRPYRACVSPPRRGAGALPIVVLFYHRVADEQPTAWTVSERPVPPPDRLARKSVSS